MIEHPRHGAASGAIDLCAQPKRLLERVQAARGIAAIMVVVAHASEFIAPGFLGNALISGTSGVDFFFVLSGFIITTAHYRDIGDRERLRPFLLKRFRRIFPAYWAYSAIAAMCVGAAALLGKHPFDWVVMSPRYFLASFALFPIGPPFLLPQAWTLSHEFLFYLLFAAAIFFGRRFAIAITYAWLIVLAAALLNVFGDGAHRAPLVMLATNPRNLAFLLGCGGALLMKRIEAYRHFILAAGVALMLMTWTLIPGAEVNWVSPAAIPSGFAFFLIVCGLAAQDIASGPMAGRARSAFMLLGNASYSIYLVHFPIVVVVGKLLYASRSPALFFAVTALSIGVGVLGYFLVERPAIRAAAASSRDHPPRA